MARDNGTQPHPPPQSTRSLLVLINPFPGFQIAVAILLLKRLFARRPPYTGIEFACLIHL